MMAPPESLGLDMAAVLISSSGSMSRMNFSSEKNSDNVRLTAFFGGVSSGRTEAKSRVCFLSRRDIMD